MAREKDSRTRDERAIDDRYDEMIGRNLGAEALDSPQWGRGRDRGAAVVNDHSDLGFQFYEPLSPQEQQDEVDIARQAVSRSYEAIPLQPGE